MIWQFLVYPVLVILDSIRTYTVSLEIPMGDYYGDLNMGIANVSTPTKFVTLFGTFWYLLMFLRFSINNLQMGLVHDPNVRGDTSRTRTETWSVSVAFSFQTQSI